MPLDHGQVGPVAGFHRLTPPPEKRLKHRVRDVVCALLWQTGHKMLRPEPGSLSIVTLHRFLPADLREVYPWPQLAVTPPAFKRMLSYFGTYFRVLPVSEALDAIDAGYDKKPLLSITVDDGQWDNYRWARPLLQRAGLRATFYIPTWAVDERKLLWPDRFGYGFALAKEKGGRFSELAELLGRSVGDLPGPAQLIEVVKKLPPGQHEEVMALFDRWLDEVQTPEWGRVMTWDEIRELGDEGHEIGGHSKTHPILPSLDDERLDDEIKGCMKRLKEELGPAGIPVRSFAYPNGDCDDRVVRVTRDAGFENAVTCVEGRADVAGDRLRLARFDLQEELAEGLLGRVDAPGLFYRLRERGGAR